MKNENINHNYRGSNTVIALSLLSISGYVLFKLTTHPISEFHFEAVFLLTFLGGIILRPWQIKFDVSLRLILLSLILPLLFFLVNCYSNSLLAIEYFSPDKLLKIMMFCAVGFWLGGKLKNIYVFLGLVFLGLVIALFNNDILQSFKNIFDGKRVSFNISNSQHTAMFFGLAVIGFISIYKELLLYLDEKKHKLFFLLLYSSALLLVIIVFIGAQTRAALLAIDILFILSIIHFLFFIKENKVSKRIIYLFGIYVVLASLILSIFSIKTLNTRGSEQEVRKELLQNNLNNIPMSSLGIRINTWIEASKWIKEKPIHGWGGKVRTQVIQQSNFSSYIKKHFGHFHNSYIEFTLGYGIIGLLFIIFVYVWMNRKIYLLAKKNPNYHSLWLFTFYGSLYFMIINIFESYVFFSTGAYATAFLLAPSYSLYVSHLFKEKIEQQNS